MCDLGHGLFYAEVEISNVCYRRSLSFYRASTTNFSTFLSGLLTGLTFFSLFLLSALILATKRQ